MIFIAFGIKKSELQQWKQSVEAGEIAYITHYWYDERFPNCKTVTKVGCSDLIRLEAWCRANGLNPAYIHRRNRYPHFDLLGPYQVDILEKNGLHEHIDRFKLRENNYSDGW